MLQISLQDGGGVRLAGVFDSSQSEGARRIFDTITTSCDVDFQGLEYISSMGLGILLATQKRLAANGQKLRLINMPQHLRKIFDAAMFGLMFEIQ